jgi:Predicted oxidoreductases of the aldo/keto reductase family
MEVAGATSTGMLYRRFGRTQQLVSVFSLGSMRLVNVPRDQAQATVEAALAAGINHIETAQAYGHAEVLLGEILQTLPFSRHQLILTSKLTPTDGLRERLQGSLRRLRVDYLDQFAFHGINLPEHLEWVLQKGLPILQQLQQEGWVRHIGFSTHGSLELILQAIQTGCFDFVNLHYHFFQQRNAPALEAAAQQIWACSSFLLPIKGECSIARPNTAGVLCTFQPLGVCLSFFAGGSPCSHPQPGHHSS